MAKFGRAADYFADRRTSRLLHRRGSGHRDAKHVCESTCASDPARACHVAVVGEVQTHPAHVEACNQGDDDPEPNPLGASPRAAHDHCAGVARALIRSLSVRKRPLLSHARRGLRCEACAHASRLTQTALATPFPLLMNRCGREDE